MNNRLTLHIDPETKRALRERADAEERSMSDLARRAIHDYLEGERAAEIGAQTLVEERIEELVSIGIDELTQTAQQIADMNAKMGVYSVANFELIKQNHPDAMRRDALSTGSRRLRDSLNGEILADLAGPPADPADGTAAADADDDDPAFDLRDRDGDRRERIERGGRK